MEKKKINLDKEKKVVNEFKEFISKGNIVDMAVGAILIRSTPCSSASF